MADERLTETQHLEEWIKAQPQVIDDSLMVITTQFGTWASEAGAAHVRPDVLALASSGELVVIELKRGRDKNVHLQAITYGALASQFTRDDLAQAYVEWRRKEHNELLTTDEALDRFSDHVQAEWETETFEFPRLVLVAEDFPDVVMSTVKWLEKVAPELTVECHEYQVFRNGDQVLVSFQKLFPVDDLESRRLRPTLQAAAADVGEQIRSNRRRARSAVLIAEHRAIPEGARIDLLASGFAQKAVVDQVEAWMREDPQRSEVTWTNDGARPLRWALEPETAWSPTALRNEIFTRAGVAKPNFSAADAWHHEGRNLYTIANELEA